MNFVFVISYYVIAHMNFVITCVTDVIAVTYIIITNVVFAIVSLSTVIARVVIVIAGVRDMTTTWFLMGMTVFLSIVSAIFLITDAELVVERVGSGMLFEGFSPLRRNRAFHIGGIY